MTTTYTEFTRRAASQKITLVHLDMKREVKVFATNGTAHTRVEDFFVVGVQLNGTILDSSGFTFEPTTNTLTVNFDGTIADQEIIVTYRLFLANFDVITSSDLTLTGPDVKYRGLIKTVPSFSTQLNFASSNKTVIGTGQLALDNSTGFFNELLQTYRFENKEFSAYSWSPTLAINEHKIIYRGITARASLGNDNLTFNIKDSIFELNNEISLEQFGNEVVERDNGRFKRNIYGKVNGMSVQSISQSGDGYALTGTINGEAGATLITGLNTAFLSELVPRDKININGTILTIRTVINDLSLLVTNALTASLSNVSAIVESSRDWYNTNRTFSVANHALKRFETTLDAFIDFRRLRVADSTGFASGDTVVIKDEEYLIDRVSKIYTDSPTNSTTADVIVLARTLSSNNLPIIGDSIITREVTNFRVIDELLIDRDLTINNADNTETTIVLSNDAEQNIAPEGVFGNDITAIADTNFFILGEPTVQTINFSNNADQDYRGLHIRLAKDDDTVASGDFIWFGFNEAIREFTTTAAALVSFDSGDIYLDTTLDEYIGIKTVGIGPRILDTDHISFGSDEPTRLLINDADNADNSQIANLLQIAFSQIRSTWLFAPNLNPATGNFQWKFFTNQGIGLVANTISLGGTNPPTINTNTLVTGATPGLDISLSENVSARDLVQIQGQVSFSQIVQAESKFLQVSEQLDADLTGLGIFKNVSYVQDDSLCTASAFGQTREGTVFGTFIKTPADAARKVLEDNGLTNFIDTTTFTDAAENADITVGIAVPYTNVGKPPTVLDFINKVTLTTLGSVGLNDDFLLKFQLLNGGKPSSLDTIRVIRNNEVTDRAVETLRPSSLFKYTIRNMESNYDIGQADPSSKFIRQVDEKIGRLADIDTTETVDLYLADQTEAENITSRFLNYSQRFNRVLSFNGSLSLSDITIGEIVLVDILELRDESRNELPFLGMVTSFARNGKVVRVSVEDFGGLFTKSATLSANDALAFSSATDTDKLLNTYLTDDNGLIDNDEDTLGTNVLV